MVENTNILDSNDKRSVMPSKERRKIHTYSDLKDNSKYKNKQTKNKSSGQQCNKENYRKLSKNKPGSIIKEYSRIVEDSQINEKLNSDTEEPQRSSSEIDQNKRRIENIENDSLNTEISETDPLVSIEKM